MELRRKSTSKQQYEAKRMHRFMVKLTNDHIISNEPVHSSIFESINRNIKFGDVRISEIGKLIPGIFSKI